MKAEIQRLGRSRAEMLDSTNLKLLFLIISVPLIYHVRRIFTVGIRQGV